MRKGIFHYADGSTYEFDIEPYENPFATRIKYEPHPDEPAGMIIRLFICRIGQLSSSDEFHYDEVNL